MTDNRSLFIANAFDLLAKTGSDRLFLFLHEPEDCLWFLASGFSTEQVVLVVPHDLPIVRSVLDPGGIHYLYGWAGNQSRFSRIKYAFLQGVLSGKITERSKVICVLGPWHTPHLDMMTIHDLSKSWSVEFPFDPRGLISKHSLHIVMMVINIALALGTHGREGKAVGTSFVVGDTDNVLRSSHQAVFNPFKGYPRRDRHISMPEVVESLKELAQLDGAILISDEGYVVAAGRHLDVTSNPGNLARGLGARHRAAAGITFQTQAVSIVVSASSGKVTIFDQGRIIASLEPVIYGRLV